MSNEAIFLISSICFFMLVIAALAYIDIKDRKDYIKELERIRNNHFEQIQIWKEGENIENFKQFS